jgi:outer membrane protein TolC
LILFLLLLAQQPAETDRPRYNLQKLIAETVRENPQVLAAEHVMASSREFLAEAKHAYWPTFSLEGLIAPSVDIHCEVPNGLGGTNPNLCLQANVQNPVQVYPTGVLTRWELRLNAPIYTFGKLGASRDSAEQGYAINEHRIEAIRQDLTLQVVRAYYALKVARELIDMIKDGRGKLEDAIKTIEEDLDKGKGNVVETDLLRLKVAEATLDSRALEAVKGEKLARAALRVLVPGAGENIDIDQELIDPVELPERPLAWYQEAARVHRPEVFITKAQNAQAKSNVDAARANFYPDISLSASVFGLWASTEDDDPLSPYMNHPFASWGYQGGVVMRWALDLHLKSPRYERAKADYEAVLAGSRAAMNYWNFDVEAAYETMQEAGKRIDVLARGEKSAHSWLTATAQLFAVGTAEARDFNDALVAYFDAHGRYLQAIYDFNTAVAQLSRVVGTDIVAK